MTFGPSRRCSGMSMRIPTLATATAAAALAVAPAAASADSLVAAAAGGQHLAAGGGYLVWSAPAPEGGFQLVVRAPDGTVTTPAVPRFRVAPDAAIGSDRFAAGDRRLLAVYGRDGDVFALDLRTGGEERVAGAASRTYEEYAPAIQYGRVVFARRGGRNNGVFLRSGDRTRRLTRARPRELAFNGTRVAYPSGRNVVIRRASGEGRPSVVPTPRAAFSLQLSRYTLTWAAAGGRLFQTPRFGGSSGIDRVGSARRGSRRLPETTNSIANSGGFVRWYLDAEGVKRIDPRIDFR